MNFTAGVALLNLGAAKVAIAGPHHLTFTAAEAVELARAWPETLIAPLHVEGWGHFTEGLADDGAAVVLYAIEGGGHTWPGGKQMPEWIVGITSNEISATNLMWTYFRAHPLLRN